MSEHRTAIFISHATPEDNDFVRWLGAKLTALGHEVWADLFALRGGSDWSRELEEALRHRAIKMLLVCTPGGLSKQGVRNEIEIATGVSKSIGDPNFIIPLCLALYEAPFRIAHLQYIDFTCGWSNGLGEVSDLLVSDKAIARDPAQRHALDQWFADQTFGSTRLVERTERLVSNWLRFSSMPEMLYYCEPPAGFNLEQFQRRTDDGWPFVPFLSGALTFAHPNAAGELRPGIPAHTVNKIDLASFRRDGWSQLGIEQYIASRIFSDLGNQAFDLYMHRRGMSPALYARGRRTWWANIRLAPKNKVSFSWGGIQGLRQIMEQSEKRGVFWNYGVNARTRDFPHPHIRVSARLLFSNNGLDIIDDPKKAHRLRRSFAKGWRNARWRDMLLAYLWWVSGGERQMALPVSTQGNLIVALPPYSYVVSFGIPETGDIEPDEDDPDVESEYWDEESNDDG